MARIREEVLCRGDGEKTGEPDADDEEQEHKAGTEHRNTNTQDIKQRSDRDDRTAVSI
jgi:hypothetical protein